ncbi:MAG: hypothetical protein ACOX2B_00570 [Syntrophothermaceae bacterium]|jgi:hypothetical protein
MSTKVDEVFQKIELLSPDDFRKLFEKMLERAELLGWLKVAEPAFSDWDNDEDAIYDEM